MSVSITPAPSFAEGQRVEPALIAPRLWEIVTLGGLSLLALMLYLFEGYDLLNATAPVAHGTVMSAAIWSLMKRTSGAIWTPLFAYRVSAALVFGLGSFISVIADALTRDYELALYAYTAAEAAKVNFIWLLSSFLLILGAYAYALLAPPERLHPETETGSTLRLGVIFFTVGFGLLCLYEIPTAFGMIDILLPGVAVLMLQAMGSVGVFLMSIWAFDKGGRAVGLIAVIFAIHVFLGLFTLNKTTILFPQMLISLAFLMHRVSAVRLGAVFVAGIMTFLVLQPLVSFGRAESGDGNLEQTFSGRLSYVPAWLRGDDVDPNRPIEQVNPLLRLSYLNAATFVVSRYDANQPSDTIDLALAALIPRALWPDKPILTAVNEELYFELTGAEGSSLATTVPVDTYWNYGWPGLMLMFGMGMLAMAASLRCYAIVAERRWIMLPFVLIAWRTANSADGQFVNTIFAPAIMAVVIYFGLKVGSSLFLSQPGRSPGAGAPGAA